MTGLCAVLDVGKTNVKLHVVDRDLRVRFRRSRGNRVIEQGIYPHFDTHALWRWVRGTLAEIAADFRIEAIAVTTHGATAALIHPDAGDSGLVLPIMDYEYAGVASEADYDALRPPFAETLSPALPAGLNLGRQLFWQQRYFERAFGDARQILPYPQYWAWRLCGTAASEVTSWGCHTDLWSPPARDYSGLVDTLGIRDKLPPLVRASATVGHVGEALAEQTGLPADCRVHAGVHDSNASYLRYLSHAPGEPFAVVSTGTWVVSFSSATSASRLDPRRDMLANVDIEGNPVACARFMGGREFDVICQRTGCKPEDIFTETDLQTLIEARVMALPDFSGGSGPFGGRNPAIMGRAERGTALASLYCALMIDYELDLLDARGDVIIEGAWLRNPLLCGLVAQLRGGQPVRLSADQTGTVSGAAQLAFGEATPPPTLEKQAATAIPGLEDYREAWREVLIGS